MLLAVNDAGLLLDGYNNWVAAGRDPNKLYLAHRYFDFYYPDFDGADKDKTLNEYKDIWRMNFAKTIDGTYYEKYAAIINLILELNEYTDTRMVTNKELLAPRLRSATAAVAVWNDEYRGKNGIRDDARLVVANSPVGNDIPKEYFQLCKTEDAVLGAHLYTHWQNRQRDPEDFRYHSGRVFYNEAEYGIKVDIAITESSPYAGVLEGWRHSNVMGGDVSLLVQGMKAWWNDMAQTNAYQEGRILGPGAWFTSSRINDQWGYYRLWDSQLIPMAEACAEVWHPGTAPIPDPEPEPEPPIECRGKPRVQYQRIYNVISENATTERAVQIFKAGWESARQTAGGAYDDAGVGDLDARRARLHDIPEERHQEFIDWYEEHYPGVSVEFPDEEPPVFEIQDVVNDLPTHDTKEYLERDIADITTLTIHHTVSPPDRSIESIAAYHVNSRGWPGIGYHYVINDLGDVFLTNYIESISYHAGVAGYDNNEVAIGIALQGDFTDIVPPLLQLEAARWLVEYLEDLLGPLEILGHRDMDGASTACPGNSYQEWIDFIIG